MLTLNSPAKINLFLQVLGRRPDGYHEIATLMQTVRLNDRLHITLAEQDQLTCSDSSIPTDEANLVRKASALFRQATGFQAHVKVHLEKNIPHQAGLGGGSGNAATTLWAMNQLTGTTLSDRELAKIGAQIGSDIPFFFSQGTAYCSGRGEKIEQVDYYSDDEVTIIKPAQGLPTPLIYKTLDLNQISKKTPQEVLNSFWQQGRSPLYLNDLEKPAFAQMPSLARLKDNLCACGFKAVLMSGSGSAFFCLGKGDLAQLPDDLFIYTTTFTYRPVNGWYI